MHEDFFLLFPSQYTYLQKVLTPSAIEIETQKEFQTINKKHRVEITRNGKVHGLGYLARSEFDSFILKRKTAKILKVLAYGLKDKKEILNKLIDLARELKITYLSYRFVHDPELIRVLELLKFAYQDTIMYLHKQLTFENSTDNLITEAKETDKSELAELAKKSFVYGRFYFDESVKSKQADEIYRQWTINSLKKEVCDEVFVYRQNNFPIGFITVKQLKTKDNPEFSVGSIELLCVDKKYQGRGIGKALLTAACNYFLGKKILNVIVDTQITNIPAFSLYIKYGFLPGKIFHTYRLLL